MERRYFLPIVLVAAGCSSTPVEPPPPASGPTWYKDVEPIVQVNCDGCHAPGGIGGLVFDDNGVASVAGLMAQKVGDGVMPPWPPGPKSKPIEGARVLTAADMQTIATWAKSGAPLGDKKDHQDRGPRVTFDPGRPVDLQAMMRDVDGYVPPATDSGLTDEVRCFVIDLNLQQSSWVTALNWVTGQPGAIHHIGGLAVDSGGAAAASKLSGADGRPGYECGGGFGKGVTAVAGFSASGAGRDTGTVLPSGTGIFVPAGSSIILSVHYIVANVKGPDRSGVQLWFASDPDKTHLRPMIQYEFTAPSELPCPSGVVMDPTGKDHCSREYGIQQVKSDPPSVTLKSNNFLLAKCGTTLDAYYAKLAFDPGAPAHFNIPTGCEAPFPYDGIIHVVHNHMHTRGAGAGISLKADSGTWDTLLDIPKYQWTWEGAYLLKEGVPVKAGQPVRVDCAYDNGYANQWSLMTHQPGHDGPATPPLEEPHYVVAGPERGDDMCSAFLTVERAPYKGASYADACHEAQAIYDDACGDKQLNLIAGACADTLELYSVLLLETAPARVYPIWCGPKDPNAKVGGTCQSVLGCALACAAKLGFSQGVPAACATACKADVNSYGPTMGQPAKAASPFGDFKLDNLLKCSNAACATEKDTVGYAECLGVACTDLATDCVKN